MQSRDDRLLPPAQAVDEQDGERALSGKPRPLQAEIGAQLLGQLPPRLDVEIRQIQDRAGKKGEVASQKPDRDDCALAPPLGGDLARRGAADDRSYAEPPGDLRREGRDVVVGRDEHGQPRKVERRKLARDFGGRYRRVLAPRGGRHNPGLRLLAKDQPRIPPARL